MLLGTEYQFHILDLKELKVVSSENVEDIHKIHQFSLEMDEIQ